MKNEVLMPFISACRIPFIVLLKVKLETPLVYTFMHTFGVRIQQRLLTYFVLTYVNYIGLLLKPKEISIMREVNLLVHSIDIKRGFPSRK